MNWRRCWEPLGFEVSRFIAGEPSDEAELGGAVENLFAIRKGQEGAKHFAYAGHLDVVPPGEGWSSDPFVAGGEGWFSSWPRRGGYEGQYRRICECAEGPACQKIWVQSV